MVQIAKINCEIKLYELASLLELNDKIKYIEYSSLIKKIQQLIQAKRQILK